MSSNTPEPELEHLTTCLKYMAEWAERGICREPDKWLSAYQRLGEFKEGYRRLEREVGKVTVYQ